MICSVCSNFDLKTKPYHVDSKFMLLCPEHRDKLIATKAEVKEIKG